MRKSWEGRSEEAMIRAVLTAAGVDGVGGGRGREGEEGLEKHNA